MFILVFML